MGWGELPWRVIPDGPPDAQPPPRVTAVLLRKVTGNGLFSLFFGISRLLTLSAPSSKGLWPNSQEQLLRALAIHFYFLCVATSPLHSPV